MNNVHKLQLGLIVLFFFLNVSVRGSILTTNLCLYGFQSPFKYIKHMPLQEV